MSAFSNLSILLKEQLPEDDYLDSIVLTNIYLKKGFVGIKRILGAIEQTVQINDHKEMDNE